MPKLRKILFLDIDNTLLIPDNVYIYLKGYRKIRYTPQQYNNLNLTTDQKIHYDFCDFRDEDIVKRSLLTSRVIKRTLSVIHSHLDSGYELGILTARGNESLIKRVMPIWLSKNLNRKFTMRQRNIHAVNDESVSYIGYTDSEKKYNVLSKALPNYKEVILIDDNVSIMNKIDKENNPQINGIYVDWC